MVRMPASAKNAAWRCPSLPGKKIPSRPGVPKDEVQEIIGIGMFNLSSSFGTPVRERARKGWG